MPMFQLHKSIIFPGSSCSLLQHYIFRALHKRPYHLTLQTSNTFSVNTTKNGTVKIQQTSFTLKASCTGNIQLRHDVNSKGCLLQKSHFPIKSIIRSVACGTFSHMCIKFSNIQRVSKIKRLILRWQSFNHEGFEPLANFSKLSYLWSHVMS